MPITIEYDLWDLIVVIGVAFLLAKDASLGEGRWARRGAAGQPRFARAMDGTAVGDVEDSEVLRDESEETRATTLDGLVELVLAGGEGLLIGSRSAARRMTVQLLYIPCRRLSWRNGICGYALQLDG